MVSYQIIAESKTGEQIVAEFDSLRYVREMEQVVAELNEDFAGEPKFYIEVIFD